MVETRPYDSAHYLDSDEAVAEYLAAAIEDGDAALFRHSLGVAARARGITQIAQDAGLSRNALTEALSAEASPSLDTTLRVLKALNVRLSAEVVPAAE